MLTTSMPLQRLPVTNGKRTRGKVSREKEIGSRRFLKDKNKTSAQLAIIRKKIKFSVQ